MVVRLLETDKRMKTSHFGLSKLSDAKSKQGPFTVKHCMYSRLLQYNGIVLYV